MDKLATELLDLLRDLLEVNERLVVIGLARQEAMSAFDIPAINRLMEREKTELLTLQRLDLNRKDLTARLHAALGRNVPTTTSQVAARVGEPLRTQLLAMAAKLRAAAEQLERLNRINSKVSQTVVNSIGRVLKVVTGIAQHAGLYMKNGRKAALRGIHLLDAVA